MYTGCLVTKIKLVVQPITKLFTAIENYVDFDEERFSTRTCFFANTLVLV